MLVTFFVSLVIGLIAFWISAHTEEDTASLATLVTTVSLLISLICAPWPLKLVVLFVLLMQSRIRPLTPVGQGDAAAPPLPNPEAVVEAGTAPFCYRGIAYAPEPSASLQHLPHPHALGGKYRGVSLDPAPNPPPSEPPPNPASSG